MARSHEAGAASSIDRQNSQSESKRVVWNMRRDVICNNDVAEALLEFEML